MFSTSPNFIHKTTLTIVLVLTLIHTISDLALANEPMAVNQPVRLVIPAIDLDSAVIPVGQKPVVVNGKHYTQWLVDDNLVGWHNLSAPLGQAGNTVFNGHSNVYGRIFRNLDDVAPGDDIIAAYGEEEYRYKVTRIFMVQEKGASLEQRIENAKLILPTGDERLTLITCAKPGATHRLIVIAHPAQ
jgi:LPXTG-site transpeptidase (sortase) family protein